MDIPEINYKIISHLHPYYLQAYCLSSKELIGKCNSYLYDLLQIWVMPDKSIREISSYFPNITLKQVVDLALVYYPIPESVSKYDLNTLVYHACRTNQFDLSYLFSGYRLEYKRPGVGFVPIDHELTTISWIAYKFNRIDVLDSFYELWSKLSGERSNNTFENMIMVKLGGRATRIAQPILGPSYFFSNLQTFLSPEEILESIIVAHRARCIPKGNQYYLLDYLMKSSDIIPEATENNYYIDFVNFVGTLINKVGVSKLDKILMRYYSDYIPSKPDRKYPNHPELLTGVEGSALWYYNHPEFTQDVDKFIAYYLTSGNYIRYIHAINLGAKLDLQPETIIGSFPMNYMSVNKDFEIEWNTKTKYDNSIRGTGHKKLIISDPSTYLYTYINDPHNSFKEYSWQSRIY